jgi:hypothetical protein
MEFEDQEVRLKILIFTAQCYFFHFTNAFTHYKLCL